MPAADGSLIFGTDSRNWRFQRGSAMPNGRKQAEIAAAAVLRVLDANPGEAGVQSVAEIIEIALHDAAREQEKKELKRIAEVQASAHSISKQGDRYLRSLFTAG